MPKTYDNLFDQISSFQCLRRSFYRAAKSKFSRTAVINFSHNLERNLFEISSELRDGTYPFGPYRSFYVTEPKLRLIEAACFRDRVVHHAIHQCLEPIFDAQFYYHSYACRSGKGHHQAMLTVKEFLRKNPEKYFLKCDIRKFFPSIDREILIQILGKTIVDQKLMECLKRLIRNSPHAGIPIGNLTSQLFANVYLNEMDQYIKRILRVQSYVRYMDDFVLIASSKQEALALKEKIKNFIATNLNLTLSPQKVLIGSCQYGISFLGFYINENKVHLRSSFFRRMKRKLLRARKKELLEHRPESSFLGTANSYMGHIKYCSNFETLKFEIWKCHLKEEGSELFA